MAETKTYSSLITSQHRSQPKFIKSVETTINAYVDCLNCINSLNEKFDIETATGDQLQIIADWVGAVNSIPNSVPIPFFGFAGQPASLPWRETTDASYESGYWRDSGMSGYSALKMSSQLFRKVVKAKTLLNNTDCTEKSAKDIISMVLDKKFKFKDNQDMTITFSFLESYETYEIELVKLMFPVPSGVKLIFEGEDEY